MFVGPVFKLARAERCSPSSRNPQRVARLGLVGEGQDDHPIDKVLEADQDLVELVECHDGCYTRLIDVEKSAKESTLALTMVLMNLHQLGVLESREAREDGLTEPTVGRMLCE